MEASKLLLDQKVRTALCHSVPDCTSNDLLRGWYIYWGKSPVSFIGGNPQYHLLGQIFSISPIAEATHISMSHSSAAAAQPIQTDENCIYQGKPALLTQKLGVLSLAHTQQKGILDSTCCSWTLSLFWPKPERLLSRGILSIHSSLNYDLEEHQPCSVIQYMPCFSPPASYIFTPL